MTSGTRSAIAAMAPSLESASTNSAPTRSRTTCLRIAACFGSGSSARTSDTPLGPHHESDEQNRDRREYEQRRMIDALILHRVEQRPAQGVRLVARTAELTAGTAGDEARHTVRHA